MKMERKRVVKFILIILAIIGVNILATFLINLFFFQHTEGLVYKTRTGHCYHSVGCGYLHSSAIAIGIEQAKKSSLRACSRCRGMPCGTTVVNNYFASWVVFVSIVAIIGIAVLYFKTIKTKKSDIKHNVMQNVKGAQQTVQIKTYSVDNLDCGNIQSIGAQKVKIVVGDYVIHKKFGKGKIVSNDGRYFEVVFQGMSEKTFIYPDAFDRGYLTKI